MRLRLVYILQYIVKTAIQVEICVAKCLNVEHFAPRYIQIRTLLEMFLEIQIGNGTNARVTKIKTKA